MSRVRCTALLVALCAVLLSGAAAAASELLEIEDTDRERTRERKVFFNALYRLHARHLQDRSLRTEHRVGGYAGLPAFYEETRYYDAATGLLLSRVQRERETGKLHVLEVFVYDAEGRLTRDYTAAFLPYTYTAPTQTLISFHRHADGLHGFRSFNASGERVIEQCEGSYQGGRVWISLEEDELVGAAPHGIAPPLYRACFEGLPQSAEGPLTPP